MLQTVRHWDSRSSCERLRRPEVNDQPNEFRGSLQWTPSHVHASSGKQQCHDLNPTNASESGTLGPLNVLDVMNAAFSLLFFSSFPYTVGRSGINRYLWDGYYPLEGVRDTGPLGWLADQGYGSNVWEIWIGIEQCRGTTGTR